MSPQISGSPYIYEIQYFGNQQNSGPLDATKGQTILSVTPLNVPNSKKQLSLITFADNQENSANIFELALTGQVYKVGQVVDYIPNVASQAGGKAYSFTAVLTKPGQQYIGDYTVAQYQSQPDYNNVIKIFRSISY